jgi:hypothetical protein
VKNITGGKTSFLYKNSHGSLAIWPGSTVIKVHFAVKAASSQAMIRGPVGGVVELGDQRGDDGGGVAAFLRGDTAVEKVE